jgi:hypothetical protein
VSALLGSATGGRGCGIELVEFGSIGGSFASGTALSISVKGSADLVLGKSFVDSAVDPSYCAQHIPLNAKPSTRLKVFLIWVK